MNANKFIKDFGIDEAKQVVANLGFDEWRKNKAYFDDLKRLVESHELVEKCSGADKVKQHLKDGNVFRFEEKPLMKHAIADVESCQRSLTESH